MQPPVLSETEYLLKPKQILCEPKKEPGAGAEEGQEERGNTEGWLGAGLLHWEGGMGQWKGTQQGELQRMEGW